MPTRSSDHSLGDGVYFATGDYARLWQRFLIDAIDFFVVLVFTIVVGIAVAIFGSWMDHPEGALALSVLVFAYLYLVVLKITPLGTLGYLLFGVRLVTLRGERPSLLRATFRFMLWILGPFNPLIDLLWLGGDKRCQTLRDKMAATYVIRRRAVPVGRGPIHLNYYLFLGNAFAFPEVQSEAATIAAN